MPQLCRILSAGVLGRGQNSGFLVHSATKNGDTFAVKVSTEADEEMETQILDQKVWGFQRPALFFPNVSFIYIYIYML